MRPNQLQSTGSTEQSMSYCAELQNHIMIVDYLIFMVCNCSDDTTQETAK